MREQGKRERKRVICFLILIPPFIFTFILMALSMPPSAMKKKIDGETISEGGKRGERDAATKTFS